jgi:hypothetical protein
MRTNNNLRYTTPSGIKSPLCASRGGLYFLALEVEVEVASEDDLSTRSIDARAGAGSTCIESSAGPAGAAVEEGAEGRESKIEFAINDCPVLAGLSAHVIHQCSMTSYELVICGTRREKTYSPEGMPG